MTHVEKAKQRVRQQAADQISKPAIREAMNDQEYLKSVGLTEPPTPEDFLSGKLDHLIASTLKREEMLAYTSDLVEEFGSLNPEMEYVLQFEVGNSGNILHFVTDDKQMLPSVRRVRVPKDREPDDLIFDPNNLMRQLRGKSGKLLRKMGDDGKLRPVMMPSYQLDQYGYLHPEYEPVVIRDYEEDEELETQ